MSTSALVDIAMAVLTANEFGLADCVRSLDGGQRDREQRRQIERAARVAARRIQARYNAATLAAIQQAIGQAADDALTQRAARRSTIGTRR